MASASSHARSAVLSAGSASISRDSAWKAACSRWRVITRWRWASTPENAWWAGTSSGPRTSLPSTSICISDQQRTNAAASMARGSSSRARSHVARPSAKASSRHAKKPRPRSREMKERWAATKEAQ